MIQWKPSTWSVVNLKKKRRYVMYGELLSPRYILCHSIHIMSSKLMWCWSHWHIWRYGHTYGDQSQIFLHRWVTIFSYPWSSAKKMRRVFLIKTPIQVVENISRFQPSDLIASTSKSSQNLERFCPQGLLLQKPITNAQSLIKNWPRSLFLSSQVLFNIGIWQNFTLEEVNLENK